MSDERIRATSEADIFALEDAIVADESCKVRSVLWISDEYLDTGVARIEAWLRDLASKSQWHCE